MTVLHGATNGVGATSSPASTWEDFADWDTGGTDIEQFSSMVEHVFTDNGRVSPDYVVKSFIGDDYSSSYYPTTTFSGSPTTLKAVAQLAPYAAVFAAHPVHILDAYSFTDSGANEWKRSELMRDLGYAYFENVYTEMYDFAEHLLSSYAGKTFVVTDQEGDWSLLDGTTLPGDNITVHSERIENMVVWHQTRMKAIKDAEKATPSTSVILYAPEVNRVVDCLGTYGDGGSTIRRVSTDVLRRLSPDLVAYSAYDSMYQLQSSDSLGVWGSSQAQFLSEGASRFADTTNYLRDQTGANVIMSEWGINLQSKPAAYSDADITESIFNTMESLGVWASVYWEVVTKAGEKYEMWDSSGVKNDTAKTFQGLV